MKHLLILSTMLAAGAAGACDICAIYAAQDAQSGPGWRAGVFGQYSHATTLREEGRKIDNGGDERLDSHIAQLIAGYRFNEVWGLQLNAPYIHRRFDRPGAEEGTRDEGDERGLGDASLLLSMRVVALGARRNHLAVHVLGGLKMPTGDSDRLLEEEEEHDHAEAGHEEGGLHDHDLALGSGSWDGVFGATLNAAADRWFLCAQALYMLRTRGDHEYTFADDTTWSLLPGYTVWRDDDGSLGLGLNLNGEHKGKDTRGDEREEGTALDSIYAGPALTATRGGSISAELALDLPVVQENSALQILPDYRIRAAVSARF